MSSKRKPKDQLKEVAEDYSKVAEKYSQLRWAFVLFAVGAEYTFKDVRITSDIRRHAIRTTPIESVTLQSLRVIAQYIERAKDVMDEMDEQKIKEDTLVLIEDFEGEMIPYRTMVHYHIEDKLFSSKFCYDKDLQEWREIIPDDFWSQVMKVMPEETIISMIDVSTGDVEGFNPLEKMTEEDVMQVLAEEEQQKYDVGKMEE